MSRITTFRFTARPTADQARAIERHIGARRFAFNQYLALVKDALDKRQSDPSLKVPTSSFSLINSINAWETSPAPGRIFVVGPSETNIVVGLPWRHQVSAQVMEEAAVDLSRSLTAYFDAKGTSRRVGFPSFQK